MAPVTVLRAVLLALAFFALQLPLVRAGIIPVSQQRGISLSIIGPPGHSNDPECGIFFNCINFVETRVATGFELFDRSLSVPDQGTAQQRSSVSSSLVRAVGFTDAAETRVDPFTYVDASSGFNLDFDVTSPETWRLQLNMSQNSCPCFGASFSLVGPGVSIIVGKNDIIVDPIAIDQLVTLRPGSYSLQIQNSIAAQEEADTMSYDMAFQSIVPEPGTVWLLIIALATIKRASLYRMCNWRN